MEAAITIDLTLNQSDALQKILTFTDNSSALGWLYKASFKDCQPVHDTVARWLARSLIKKGSALYSQHIKGKHNFIADSLSRDFHIHKQQLNHSFHTLLSTQTHPNFEICPLNAETNYWIRSTLQSSTKTQALPEQPNHSKVGVLTNVDDSYKQWASKMSGLKSILQNREHTCCPRLRAVVDKINMVKQERQYSPAEQSKPPSRMYVRPFERIFGQTQL